MVFKFNEGIKMNQKNLDKFGKNENYPVAILGEGITAYLSTA